MKHRALPMGLAVFLAGCGLFLSFTLLQHQTHAQGGSTIYVAPGGDCGGMLPCCAHPQDAVDAATHGDVIKVAAGTYTDVDVRPRKDITTAGVVTQVVYISNSVTIRGGYTTDNWDTPDPEANATTLDARGQGRVFYITGEISPTIEGLRITGGDATGLGGSTWGFVDAGGAVYAITATVIVRSSQLFSNTAVFGGGLYLISCDATLSDSTVSTNTAGFGGGLCLDSSLATVSGNTVSVNGAIEGGGIYVTAARATITNNQVFSNAAMFGGGLHLISSDAVLSNNAVSANTALLDGGGLSLVQSTVSLRGNTVSRNNTGTFLFGAPGGGLSLYGSDATFSDNTVCSNAADYGGALYLSGSDVRLTNNMVADNRATAGSGLFIQRSSCYLLHTTVAHSTGGGSGLYITNYGPPYSTVALTNTILVSHTVGLTVATGNTVTLEGTLWYGNGQDTGGAGTILTGTVNIWGDPGFVDPDGGDYHIGATSAAIDTGLNAGVTTDIDGQPRPIGAGFDIGADEYSFVVGEIYLPVTLKGHSPATSIERPVSQDLPKAARTHAEPRTKRPNARGFGRVLGGLGDQ